LKRVFSTQLAEINLRGSGFIDPVRSQGEILADRMLAREGIPMTDIALVDDDISIRRSISRLLRSHGYGCVTYESGESALADPGLMNMGCLLIDLELFGMDGFELRDRLRSLGSSIPYIFVTAHSEADIPEWSSRMRDSYFLTKPVEERLLLSAIERVTPRKGGLPAR
jgi:FixJ family two-component response regulator